VVQHTEVERSLPDNATPPVKAGGKRKRELTAAERKAIGERFRAGREAARLRRATNADSA
jgi:hypothetical protein